MPAYPWLMTDRIDFASLPTRIRAQQAIGVPYSEQERREAIPMAQKQAKEIADSIVSQGGPSGLEDKLVVALIAYLQRLGTDLYKPTPDTATPTAAESTRPTTRPEGVADAGAR
jgi:cytochrome c oxidase cbb3-type subunit I/II